MTVLEIEPIQLGKTIQWVDKRELKAGTYLLKGLITPLVDKHKAIKPYYNRVETPQIITIPKDGEYVLDVGLHISL